MLERPYGSNHLPDKPGSDQVAITSPGKSTGDAALYLGSRCLAQTLTPPPPQPTRIMMMMMMTMMTMSVKSIIYMT